MRTTNADVRSLLDRVDRGEIRLPEIQRAYVWKPAQVAGLLDSMYRKYPSGSLLLWETDSPPEERKAAIQGPQQQPMVRPQYLLDGQQRLTSLHRVYTNHPDAQVVFNVDTERFQIQSAATKNDARWVSVPSLLVDDDVYDIEERLVQRLPGMDRPTIRKRLDRVRRIADYGYHIEIIDNLPYAEVTEIFVRVNSRGRALKTTDLALATLSSRWPGVVAKLEDEARIWTREGYAAVDVTILTKALAAVATESRSLSGFSSAPLHDIVEGWVRVRRGLGHLIPMLKRNARIETSTLLPSANALIPLVVYLGKREDRALASDEADALIYWLFGAFITGRFSGAADTAIAQDALAARSDDPIASLYGNLGLMGSGLRVTEEALVGRGAGSAYFLLSYLASVRAKAKDWWHGIDIGLGLKGNQALEYHHIHPKARLADRYTKAEINDLANLAFISAKANRKISNRPPVKYFEELGADELAAHFVPTDHEVLSVEGYPGFVRERRRLLAQAMSDLLESFRPTSLPAPSGTVADPSTGEALSVDVYADASHQDDGVVAFTARRNGTSWRGRVRLRDLLAFLEDVDRGLAAGLAVDGEVVVAQAGQEQLDLPLGPLTVSGTPAEWRAVLEREMQGLLAPESAPDLKQEPWAGDRVAFSVIDSD